MQEHIKDKIFKKSKIKFILLFVKTMIIFLAKSTKFKKMKSKKDQTMSSPRLMFK